MCASGGQRFMRRDRGADRVEHWMPSQIVVEVARRYAAKALHPAFPPAVIRIDVPHMKRWTALGEVDRLMRDASILGVALVDRRAIGAQHRFPFQAITHRVIDALVIDRFQGIRQGVPIAITPDNTPTSSSGSRPFRPFLAPPPRWRGGRYSGREPLCDRRMNVSSASAIPASCLACMRAGAARNRWRQRKAVLR